MSITPAKTAAFYPILSYDESRLLLFCSIALIVEANQPLGSTVPPRGLILTAAISAYLWSDKLLTATRRWCYSWGYSKTERDACKTMRMCDVFQTGSMYNCHYNIILCM